MRITRPVRYILCAFLFAPLLAPLIVDAQDKKEPFEIFAVLWRGETAVEDGFRDYLDQNNIPYNMTVRSLNLDRANAPALVEEIRYASPDLVYTWGTGSTLGIVGSHDTETPENFIRDIPAIFVLVAYPKMAKIVESYESTGRAVSGVVFLTPLDAQMNAIRAYRPFKKLASIYDSTSSNVRINVGLLKEAVPKAGMEFVPIPIGLDENGKSDPDSLQRLVREAKAQGVEVLYIGPDSFFARHGDLFNKIAIEEGLPTFAATEFPVKRSHSLFGLISDYYTVGKLAGLQAEKILVEGVHPKDLPLAQLERHKLWINVDVARALKLYPPMNMVSIADFNDSGYE